MSDKQLGLVLSAILAFTALLIVFPLVLHLPRHQIGDWFGSPMPLGQIGEWLRSPNAPAWVQAVGSVVAIFISGFMSFWMVRQAERAKAFEAASQLRDERIAQTAIYLSTCALLASAADNVSRKSTAGAVHVVAQSLAGMREVILRLNVTALRDEEAIADLARLPGVLGDHANSLGLLVDGIEMTCIFQPEHFGTLAEDMRQAARRLKERVESLVKRYDLPTPRLLRA